MTMTIEPAGLSFDEHQRPTATIPSDFDDDDDPYQSLPAYLERLDEAWAEIIRLELVRHALELLTLGFTVLEPERVGTTGFAEEVLRATLDVAKRRRGVDYEIDKGVPSLNLYGEGADTDANERYILLESDKYMLFEDPIFEQVLIREQALALVTLLIGRGCLLDRMYSLYRHANTPPLPLHTETGHPSPFPSYPTLASVTWCLTDFNGVRDGATCYVPGTHKFCRRPTKREGYGAMSHARCVVAPAGSVLIHNGATWHGAPTRQAEGLRVSLNMFYVKGNLPQSEGYRGKEPDGLLERNPPRVAHLLGHSLVRGHGAEGYDTDQRSRNIETGLL